MSNLDVHCWIHTLFNDDNLPVWTIWVLWTVQTYNHIPPQQSSKELYYPTLHLVL